MLTRKLLGLDKELPCEEYARKVLEFKRSANGQELEKFNLINDIDDLFFIIRAKVVIRRGVLDHIYFKLLQFIHKLSLLELKEIKILLSRLSNCNSKEIDQVLELLIQIFDTYEKLSTNDKRLEVLRDYFMQTFQDLKRRLG